MKENLKAYISKNNVAGTREERIHEDCWITKLKIKTPSAISFNLEDFGKTFLFIMLTSDHYFTYLLPPSSMTNIMILIPHCQLPFLSSNIPSSPSYGVYISQLIRYARCCSYYDDFGYRHKHLVDRLLSQGYEVKGLRNSFKKFYGRYLDLIGKYQKSVKDMMAASFPD